MKKIILLALTALVMAGCISEQERDEILKHKRFQDFQVVVVDSCEYVYRYFGSSGMAAHKGNCKFCAERRQKELKELVEQIKEK